MTSIYKIVYILANNYNVIYTKKATPRIVQPFTFPYLNFMNHPEPFALRDTERIRAKSQIRHNLLIISIFAQQNPHSVSNARYLKIPILQYFIYAF